MNTVIVWFRQDLRLDDHPALHYALQQARRVIPVYIHSADGPQAWQPGAAGNWWLHHSLVSLRADIRRQGGRLVLRSGDAADCLMRLCHECEADAVFANRRYEPALARQDVIINKRLAADDRKFELYEGSLLHAPEAISNQSGLPYKVFTPFYKYYLKQGISPDPCPAPRKLPAVPQKIKGVTPADLELLPEIKWYKGMQAHWQPGEAGARQQLEITCEQRLPDYPERRDIPSLDGTSNWSPHLHFGELGIHRVLAMLQETAQRERTRAYAHGSEHLIRELVWREFAHHILQHFPHTTDQPFDTRFAKFPWKTRPNKLLRAWQQGMTGYPIVDAGMRQLWQTGWMHNRVRMITGSFLTKNLGFHWRIGARWFWDTLVDADLANNTMNWQWVAGCGVDAAPYFRIFNPVTQSRRFDPKGEYLRRWIPEIASLDDRNIHEPWKTPTPQQQVAGIRIGRDYPEPVVDLITTRRAALALFRERISGRVS